MDLEASKKKVKALTEPRNAVLVGANDRPGSWAWRVLRNLKQYEFPQPLYLVNPRRTKIGGDRCYPDFKSLPEPPDHLVVLVPASGVPEVLRSGAAAGARSATVFSSGFGEAYNTDAAPLGRELKAVIAETGLAVSGPNCMGNICAKTRLVTLSEDRPLLLRQGPIALVGQSGGMMIFLNAALEERGMNAEYLITSGNEAGLGIPDYIAFFSDQPELKVIIVYIEAIGDIEKFKAACRMARAAGKAIVAVKLGQSESGRNAAMAHTASLAGSIEAFDAVAADVGIVRADTLDDAVEISELLVHTGAPGGRRLGAITLSGAFRGLLYDAAERNGLQFPKLADATLAKLNAILGVGSLVSNPIDGGFGVLSSDDNYKASIAALQADPNIDMILIQENLPREPGSDRAERYIHTVEAIVVGGAPKPIAIITPVSHSQSDYSRALRAQVPHVSFLLEVNKSLRAIASVARRDELEQLATPSDKTTSTPAEAAAAARVRALAKSGGALDEVEIETVDPRLWHPDADGDRGAVAGRRREGSAADWLSGSAQGGRGEALAQIGCRGGRVASRRRRGSARGLWTYRRQCPTRRNRNPRCHAGLPTDQRRVGACARAQSRSGNGPRRHGRLRRRAARTDQGRGVRGAAAHPRQGACHDRTHPRRAADARLSLITGARRRCDGRRISRARTHR